MTNAFLLFVALQAADFVTTALALRLGGAETNPLVSHLMTAGPLGGVLAAKLFSLGIGAICLLLKKHRAIRVTNVAFTAIVAWNVSIVARLLASAA
jgi:Domain of unknown function (DUF5658)